MLAHYHLPEFREYLLGSLWRILGHEFARDPDTDFRPISYEASMFELRNILGAEHSAQFFYDSRGRLRLVTQPNSSHLICPLYLSCGGVDSLGCRRTSGGLKIQGCPELEVILGI